MTDLFGLIADIFKAAYLAARNRPQVTCDLHGVFKARWYADYIHDDEGRIIAEGIRIELAIKILLANNGPVDTTLKDAYVVIKHDRKELCRLSHSLDRYHIKVSGKDRYFDTSKIYGTKIKSRDTWGPHRLEFGGNIWKVKELPQDLKAELIIEPVAQRPVRKKILLHF